ncbi:6-carboxytetrahydropterin synthase QueD [Limnofasciculus baicalensis]|uniref:6-carboxy-5,6,7,8-tetrahydropterin synthase n=1 Tax=Limnofasciculus baicalensis BBK-W-15 TaxID=2699891 RepID=A0AAE3GNT2_9CYAN|nr:6-carboxytetrahydropterin synthase QueD [Limnofasciculus baicalensis]MCP2727975.1 6-carboxytetrahydropterin synthase QueD [Limnofasciculus baicalensis BBK-W-15]
MTNHQWLIAKEFRFEAAHKLPYHDGKCARLHGHSWRGVVYVAGDTLVETGPKQGMVIDYSDIKKYLQPLVENYLDHYDLNETTGLESPTSEQIAAWIYQKLEEAGLKGLMAVRIDETCTSICLYSKIRIAGSLNSSESLNLLNTHQGEDGVGMNLATIL